mgnify:CR=1 FL=1
MTKLLFRRSWMRQFRWNLMKIQPPVHMQFSQSRENQSPSHTPFWESIHSLSMCGWVTLKHKMMNHGPDVRDVHLITHFYRPEKMITSSSFGRWWCNHTSFSASIGDPWSSNLWNLYTWVQPVERQLIEENISNILLIAFAVLHLNVVSLLAINAALMLA